MQEIDPITLAAGPSYPLATTTSSAIAVSDDRQFLYVALSDGTIERLRFADFSPDLIIDLGRDSNNSHRYASSIAPQPGAPHTIAVSISGDPRGTSDSVGIAIYDDDVMRAGIVGTRELGSLSARNLPRDLYWVPGSSTLYGASSIVDPVKSLFSFNVNSSGVTLASTTQVGRGGRVSSGGGRLFTDEGAVADPATGVALSPLQTYTKIRQVEPDSESGRLFVMNGDFSTPGQQQRLTALDLQTLTSIGEITVPFDVQGRLISLGRDGLAVFNGRLFIISGPFVSQ